MKTDKPKIIVRGDRVLISPMSREAEKTQFIVEAMDQNSQGEVSYVGPKVKDLRPGMIVYFSNQRNQITIEGKIMMVMREENVVALQK